MIPIFYLKLSPKLFLKQKPQFVLMRFPVHELSKKIFQSQSIVKWWNDLLTEWSSKAVCSIERNSCHVSPFPFFEPLITHHSFTIGPFLPAVAKYGEGNVFTDVCLFTDCLPLPNMYHWSHDKGVCLLSRLPSERGSASRKTPDIIRIVPLIGFFTNSPQNKNGNIANFILAVPFQRNWTNKVCNLNMYSYYIHWF